MNSTRAGAFLILATHLGQKICKIDNFPVPAPRLRSRVVPSQAPPPSLTRYRWPITGWPEFSARKFITAPRNFGAQPFLYCRPFHAQRPGAPSASKSVLFSGANQLGDRQARIPPALDTFASLQNGRAAAPSTPTPKRRHFCATNTSP